VVNGVLQRPTGGSLVEQLAWLRYFAQGDSEYLVEIRGNESITPSQAALPTGRTNLTIILRGIGGTRFVNLASNGRLFDIVSGVTLVLDENVILVGRHDNIHHLVRVESGGALIMNAGSMITGNMNMQNSWCCCYRGGGVRIRSGGTFTMFGGEISGNFSASWSWTGHGGGVMIDSGGTFDMRGGAISNNHADGNGGGVFNEGTFRMSDGIIYGSAAADGYRNTVGGSGAALLNSGTAQLETFSNDVFESSGTLSTTAATIHVINGVLQRIEGGLAEQLAWLHVFAQSGGSYIIDLMGNESITPSQAALPTDRTNLTITLRGIGGMRFVNLSSNGRLFDIVSGVTLVLDENVTLNGVSSNSYHLVRVNSGGTLVMNTGSVITGNTNAHASCCCNRGGGVRVNSGGTLNMFGGEISGNVSSSWSWDGLGGGVFVAGGTFNMRGGAISGNHADWVGGGVLNEGTFRISDGIIHGNNTAETWLHNTVGSSGAALSNSNTANRGTFDDIGDFSSLATLGTTNDTIHIGHGLPALTGTVGITGNAWVGQVLTADTEGLGGSGDFTFQWMRGDTAVGTDSATYIVQVADVGHAITVTVTRSDRFGSVTSLPTDPVESFLQEERFIITFAEFQDVTTDITGPTIRLVGSQEETSRTITVDDPGQYDSASIRWFHGRTQIIGSSVSGTHGETITLDSRVHGNQLGTHFLTVEVRKNGVPFSKVIYFVVVP